MAQATEAPAEAAGLTSHTHFPVPTAAQTAALDRLRTPFEANQISKLPKVTCGACTKAQYKVCDNPQHRRERCTICGGNMTTAHIHLDYVGHAELTGRLLEADPLWQWEPLSFDDDGLPRFDRTGGLWIRLTVAGVTRLGYGDAQGKTGPNAVKEAIGDALRNAGMRFGAALALWSKTDMDTSKAEADELGREPSRDDRLAELYQLMQNRWGHAGGLRNVKALVDNEEFTGSLVLDEKKERKQFGTLLQERIAELEVPKPTTGASPTSEQASPAAGTAAPDGPPPAEGSTEGADLDKLTAQARTHWDKPVVLKQVRGAAAHAGFLDRNVEGPWGRMGFGALLDRRLAELATDPERSAA